MAMLWRFCSLWAAEAADVAIEIKLGRYTTAVTDRLVTEKMQMKNDLAEEGAGYKSVEIFSANRHKERWT